MSEYKGIKKRLKQIDQEWFLGDLSEEEWNNMVLSLCPQKLKEAEEKIENLKKEHERRLVNAFTREEMFVVLKKLENGTN